MRADKLTLGMNGQDVTVDSVRVGNNVVIITGDALRLARIKDELYEDVDDPEAIVKTLRAIQPRPDIFTFCQRLPETQPKFHYRFEPESIAALPITTYEEWFNKQIGTDTRKLIRRAEKKGCVIKQCMFDDAFVSGMTRIFNETPVRQGRRFWHYGKDFSTLKREFSRFLFREDLFGAFFQEKLIGFIFLAYASNYAYLGQIISEIKHRDKYTNNALIAKAVEVAASKKIPALHYGFWPRGGGLEEFKRRNGFVKVDLPRYYIPLTSRGAWAMKLNLHRGFSHLMPEGFRTSLRNLRAKWYERKYGLAP